MVILESPTCGGVSILEEDVDKLNKLEELADCKLSFNVRDYYSRSFLLCYVWRCRNKLTVEEMVEKLEDAVKVREDIHELERKMDKNYFHWLVVEQDIFASSGFQKGTDNRVFWLRVNALFKGIWKLKVGTPKACAFVRAWIYFYETAHAQANHMPGRRFVFFCDPNGQGLLDFNIQLTIQVYSFLMRLFFMDNEIFTFFGHGKIVPVFMNQVKVILGERMDNVEFRPSDNKPQDALENSSDIPKAWAKSYNERGEKRLAGKARSREDRRNVWLFERVITDDDSERLTTADVYNGGPWPFEEYEEPSLQLAEHDGLDSFDSDEDDEF